MILTAVNRLRNRSGYLLSLGLLGATIAFTYKCAPKLEKDSHKYVWAGTTATVVVEALTHGIDTLNMRSKIINGPKIYIYELLRVEGIGSLLKGIQPILYGYIFSSFIYFTVYAQSKVLLKKLLYPNGET